MHRLETAPPPDMTIETWQGKDVLLIVEKGKKSKTAGAAEPIDIQVTRNGKDVRIETTCAAGWEHHGMNVSFRLVIPEQSRIAHGNHKESSNLSELTTKVWKALHREALIRMFL
ncbi:MAG: hypothetical protein ABIA59_03100 [Candidatus Latescibacterota bacterium]